MDLELLRQEIRRTDMEIIDLISRRTDLAEQIGRIKKENGSPIRNVAVEKKVIERYTDASASSGVSEETLSQIAKALIKEAVDREASIPGAYHVKKDIAVIGGSGKMGKWISDLLKADGHTITDIDPRAGNGLSVEDAKNADVVIISVPIDATDGVLRQLDGICRPDALIFDLTSLKTPVSDTLKDMAKRRKVTSMHPMFGPSASSIYNRNLIVCDCGCKKAVDEAVSLFDDKGGNLRIMDLDKHDEYMSYVLGLSHAVNIAFFTVLQRSGISFEDMCTVASTTFRKNMETNESVAMEDPKLYYDIQHMNCHRDAMWNTFSDAVEDLKKASLEDDNTDFIRMMDTGREYFSSRD